MIYGYCRVSARDQNLERQIVAMKEFGIEEKNIFKEKQSGKDFERIQYKKVIHRLKPGDVFVVKSIDRMGRNYEEIIAQWKLITREKAVDIVVLDMPLLDTRVSKDLTGTLISDIVLQLLSYVAQTERDYIKKRQAEGIAAAKARGVRFGAKPKKQPSNFEDIYLMWKNGEISAREAGRRLDVSHTTFVKWTKM